MSKDKIRLIYVNMSKHRNIYTDELKFEQEYVISSPFQIPNGLRLDEAYEMISYITDKIESQYNLEEVSIQSVQYVANLLSDYGFKKLDAKKFNSSEGYFHKTTRITMLSKVKCEGVPEIQGIVDLMTVNGDIKCFDKSKMAERYFDWYTENVTDERFDELTNLVGRIHEQNIWVDPETERVKKRIEEHKQYLEEYKQQQNELNQDTNNENDDELSI